ncbi:hypothetical protein ARMGADRAFT_361711 [Armillaria gallica]|uniref:Uncharacterized protein n=1 Tax=Armillaria gallica TaxID=47427 RepID=A0A2H3CZS9_ARMGA|nr:hypothetical protein ARMGADRAFT_361711 [Armillaria gallica]
MRTYLSKSGMISLRLITRLVYMWVRVSSVSVSPTSILVPSFPLCVVLFFPFTFITTQRLVANDLLPLDMAHLPPALWFPLHFGQLH